MGHRLAMRGLVMGSALDPGHCSTAEPCVHNCEDRGHMEGLLKVLLPLERSFRSPSFLSSPTPGIRNGSSATGRVYCCWRLHARAPYHHFVISDANQPYNRKVVYQGSDHNSHLESLCLTSYIQVFSPSDVCASGLGSSDNTLG